jgi:hypothetical protein
VGGLDAGLRTDHASVRLLERLGLDDGCDGIARRGVAERLADSADGARSARGRATQSKSFAMEDLLTWRWLPESSREQWHRAGWNVNERRRPNRWTHGGGARPARA